MSSVLYVSNVGFCLQGSERHKFPNSNPFVEEDMDKSEVASVAYRWVLTSTGETQYCGYLH